MMIFVVYLTVRMAPSCQREKELVNARHDVLVLR